VRNPPIEQKLRILHLIDALVDRIFDAAKVSPTVSAPTS
jgi:hypothetical protein